MKKISHDPGYTKKALYIFFTGAALLLFWKLLNGNWNLVDWAKSVLQFLWGAVSTVIAGLVIAYILLPAAEALEKLLMKIFRKKQVTRRISNWSVAIVYILLVALIVLTVAFVVPGIVQNIVDLAVSLPIYYNAVADWYENSLQNSEFFKNTYTQNAINQALVTINSNLNQWVVTALSGIAAFVYRFFVSIFKAVLAIIISIYFMIGRKDLREQTIKVSEAYLGEKRTINIRSFLRSVNWVFGRYISANLVKTLIVFVMTEVVFVLLGVPYSTLMSGIVAVTNIVPFIGPIIGLIPPVAVSLLQSPIKALWVFLAFEGIQAIDGYLLQPYLIGDKLGLSPFWVLASVLIGGAFFGLWGVILAVPVTAVIKILIRQYIRRKDTNKKMEEDMKQ